MILGSCLQIKVAPKQVQNEEKGDASAVSLAVVEKENDHKPFTTLEELKGGRLPPEEILSLPMFKVLELCASLLLPMNHLLSDYICSCSFLYKAGSVEPGYACFF